MGDLGLINDLLSDASYSFDDLDIPNVDIQYQEDDGNSNCDSGSCAI